VFIDEATRNEILQSRAGNNSQNNWLNNLLQQGKGLIQQGQNWFTGNNLTSQDPNTIRAMNAQPFDANERINDTSFSDLSYQDLGGVHPPRTHSGLRSTMPHDIPNFREDYVANLGSTYPQPFERPNMLDVSGEVGEYSQKPWETGIMRTNQAQKKDGILQNIKNWGTNILDNTMLGKFAAMRNPLNKRAGNYNPALAGQIEDLNKINFLSGSEGQTGPYQITGGPLQNKNLVSMFGTNDYDEMLAKRAAWFQRRKDLKKGFSRKNWDAVIAEQKARAVENAAREYDGAQRFDPSGPTQASIRRDRPDKSGLGHRGGFTDPGRDSYGPHKRADGGRIGYQGGELVGQETDFIEGPQGGEEFQETVVEGEEQPSREQLEALAMEIFQLPLEELDEEQLLVVYQAAMQGQPMEEDFQEQDIQFADQGQPMEGNIREEDIQYAAAGGGRIGFRYGGLVSLL